MRRAILEEILPLFAIGLFIAMMLMWAGIGGGGL